MRFPTILLNAVIQRLLVVTLAVSAAGRSAVTRLRRRHALVGRRDGRKPSKRARACAVMAIAVGVTYAAVAYADSPSSPSLSPYGANEVSVLTNRGISRTRALEALSLQEKVAGTHVAKKIEAALAGAYAGVWLEPATATFHIGVTSAASRRAARMAVAQAGLTSGVVETPVRSTWAALIAAQTKWNRKLSRLIAREEAATGIDARGNEVLVTLSASVPSRERAAIKREATIATANVIVNIEPAAALHPERKAACKSPFDSAKAYCEKTIVSGVRLAAPEGGCTAGPMLIEGNTTYVLTAGHCFGTNKANVTITAKVTSEYVTGGGQKDVGNEGKWYENHERDVAEVKVKLPGSFTEGLPNPVPALMAEWSIKPATPAPVGRIKAAEVIAGQSVCHEGQKSGEHCGEITLLNDVLEGTEHLVVITACSNRGDSGGPYFFRATNKEIAMMGTEVGGPPPDCTAAGPYRSYFEPLEDLPGAAGFGTLAVFPGQSLLTTANEVRPSSAKFSASSTGKLTAKALSTQVLKTIAGNVECTGLTATEGSMVSLKTTELTITVQYEKCKALGLAATVSPAKYLLTSGGFASLLKTVTVKAFECTITVPSTKNRSLKTVRYDNVSKQILVLAAITGITSTGSGIELCSYPEESQGSLEGRTDIGLANGGTMEWG